MTDGFAFPLIMTALAVASLLFLVLVVRVPAFLALVMTSLGFGLSVGMAPADIIAAIQNGMGGTLGFIAVVVGLGAILGAVLEVSGGIQVIANSVLNRLGEHRASWGLAGVGFLAAIPVFFDVALIILLPVLWSLREQSGRPLVLFAIPLLAGLAAAHALAPPTPGPIAVADILGADLGWVIVFGVIAGIPAVAVAGPVLARHLATLPTFQVDTFAEQPSQNQNGETSRGRGAALALSIILLPLLLIVAGAVATSVWPDEQSGMRAAVLFIGHPFVALLAACLYAWVIATRLWGCSSERMLRATSDALAPAGAVILVTGAGGAFKQVLVDSGAGANLAAALTAGAMPPLVFAFLIAALVRAGPGLRDGGDDHGGRAHRAGGRTFAELEETSSSPSS